MTSPDFTGAPARWRNGVRGFVHKHSLPTIAEAQERYAHGTRARYYLAKCRCFPCRLANSEYEAARNNERRPPWQVRRVERHVDVSRDRDANGGLKCRFCGVVRKDQGITRHERACALNPEPHAPFGWIIVNRHTGEQKGGFYQTCPTAKAERDRLNRRDRPKAATQLVSAAKSRKHLLMLQSRGIGYCSVALVARMSSSVVYRIMVGMISRTRRSNEAKILAVTVAAAARGTAKIDGRQMFEQLDRLVAAQDRSGKKLYTKTWLARQLGCRSKTPVLQIGRSRTGLARADKAKAVAELYERLWAEDPRLRIFVDPVGEHARLLEAQRLEDESVAASPLSKRDPAIAARWDALFRESGAAL